MPRCNEASIHECVGMHEARMHVIGELGGRRAARASIVGDSADSGVMSAYIVRQPDVVHFRAGHAIMLIVVV